MGETRQASILVVDDEADVVESIRELLRLDYRVLVATRASEAMSILDARPVDVVMTDQRMPEMTGVELLHHVRETQPDTVRLLFTGYADVRAVIDAINRGNIYRYITKPWDPEELQGIVRDAVERRAARVIRPASGVNLTAFSRRWLRQSRIFSASSSMVPSPRR